MFGCTPKVFFVASCYAILLTSSIRCYGHLWASIPLGHLARCGPLDVSTFVWWPIQRQQNGSVPSPTGPVGLEDARGWWLSKGEDLNNWLHKKHDLHSFWRSEYTLENKKCSEASAPVWLSRVSNSPPWLPRSLPGTSVLLFWYEYHRIFLALIL